MSLQTVADLVANSLDLADIDVTDLLNDSPYLAQAPVETSSKGDVHKYAKETQEPVVGFRPENTGRQLSSSKDTLVTVDLKILDFSWAVDKAVADVWIRGAADYIAREGSRHIRAGFFKAEQQFFNGTEADPTGFNGLADTLNALSNEKVIDAGGIADLTSVYVIRQGVNDVIPVMHGDGIMLGTTIVQNFTTASAATEHDVGFPSYYTPGVTWMAQQAGSIHSAVRIANLPASGNTLDDAMLSLAISLFPAGRGPTHIVMNRRSLQQLQASRTATNPTGAPAPFPTEAFNVPILTTDAIGNDETAVA